MNFYNLVQAFRTYPEDFANCRELMNFYGLAQAFSTAFPAGNLDRYDSRPLIDGFLINAYLPILPSRNETETREAALGHFHRIIEWLKEHAETFGAGDKVQVVVGFPEIVKPTNRQIYKGWSSVSNLRAMREAPFTESGGTLHEIRGWEESVTWAPPVPRVRRFESDVPNRKANQ